MLTWKGIEPSLVFDYLDGAGVSLGRTARYDMPDGHKEFTTWLPDGKNKGWPEPRPLYGLWRLAGAKPMNPVMVVEGEKCADALARLTPSYVPIAWPNGAASVKYVDWSPLAGRTVVLWPDRDEPGRKAMASVSEELLKLKCDVKVIVQEGTDGWDVADAVAKGWDWKAVVAWAKERVKVVEFQAEPPKAEVLAPVKAATKPKPATADTDDEHVDLSVVKIWRDAKMTRRNNGEGMPHPNASNIAKLMDYHGFDIFLDLNSQQKYTTICWFDGSIERGKERMWDSLFDAVKFKMWLQQQPGFEMCSSEAVDGGIEMYAIQNSRNRPQEWVRGLAWDGTKRLHDWLSRVIGVDQNAYHSAVGRYTLLSIVARVLTPGCQVHSALTLVGPEGLGKSGIARILGGEWYASIGISFDAHRDMAKLIQGTIVAELAENESSIKATAESMKRMFTDSKDRVIEKYKPDPHEIERTGVFIITANHAELFTDDTGFRRFLPVTLRDPVDFKLLEDEREQLFAEARVEIESGIEWWKLDGVDAKNEARKYRVQDPLEQPIAEIVERHSPGDILSIADVLTAMMVPYSQHTMQLKRRVGACLRLAGCESDIVHKEHTTFLGFRVK